MGEEAAFLLAFPADLWGEMISALDLDVETAGVILAGVADGEGIALLGRRIAWVPEASYHLRTRTKLSIASAGYVPALASAAMDRSVAVFFHTHPGGGPQPSPLDDEVDAQVRSLFMLRTHSPLYASLILGGTSATPQFWGRLYRKEATEPLTASHLRIVGDQLKILFPPGQSDEPPAQMFDRQVRAFGREGQTLLSRLNIGVVGAGGTGSAVCEQLLRLGVGRLTVLDDDVVDMSNLTRVHESQRSDVGRAKVDVVARRAEAIGLGTQVKAVPRRLRSPEAVRHLAACDAAFGCTDDEFGRAVLSRLAYWYLLPVFDTGVVINSQDGEITDVIGRVTVLTPGTACLLCRRRISPAGIQVESMTPEERVRRAGEGYAPEIRLADPSVVTFTTMVGALAVSEFLERLFGYGAGARPGELLVRFRDRALSRNSAQGQIEHYCTDRERWGRGDETPLLGQLWPSTC